MTNFKAGREKSCCQRFQQQLGKRFCGNKFLQPSSMILALINNEKGSYLTNVRSTEQAKKANKRSSK